MKHAILMNKIRGLRAILAGFALMLLASLGSAQNANAAAASSVNTQTAELQDLLSAVHQFTSYNGSAETAAVNLVAWEQFWAEDATLVVNPGPNQFYREGREAIIDFFAITPIFNNNWVGLAPSFRTKVEIHGNTAEIYLECMFVDETGTIVFPRAFHGTVRKSGGAWLFWRMISEAAQPLFP